MGLNRGERVKATEKKTAANRKNALRSTGPKTPQGKSRVSKNALRHGFFATGPVVPHWESAHEWEAHRDAIHGAVVPVGYLEERLTDRLALLLWRLRRVERFETEALSQALEAVGQDIDRRLMDALIPSQNLIDRKIRDAELALEGVKTLREGEDNTRLHQEEGLALYHALWDAADELADGEIGCDCDATLPDELADGDAVASFDNWTVGLIRSAVDALTEACECTVDELLDSAESQARRDLEEWKEKSAKRAGATLTLLRDRMIPGDKVSEKVSRYETTAERSFYRTLHELQRLQAARKGEKPSLPVAIDIGVQTTE